MDISSRKGGTAILFDRHGNELLNTVVIAPSGQGMSLNPFAEISENGLEALLRSMCSEGLSSAELAELEDQIEAVAPALIELRDGGHLDLNVREVANAAKLEGMVQLADDERLSELSRNRCRALRDRYLAQGVKALLGNL